MVFDVLSGNILTKGGTDNRNFGGDSKVFRGGGG